MKIKQIFAFSLLAVSLLGMQETKAQTFLEKSFLGFSGGYIKYSGDAKVPKGHFAFSGHYIYEFSDQFYLRGNILLGKVSATDLGAPNDPSNPPVRPRPFQSNIQEISLLPEYDILNIYDVNWTPYVFAGIGYFHYRPYKDSLNADNRYEKVYYSLEKGNKQLNISFGAGLKYALSADTRLFAEGTMRRTGTDEIDAIWPHRGSKHNDTYYNIMVGISFRLGKTTESRDMDKGRGRSGCPPVYN